MAETGLWQATWDRFVESHGPRHVVDAAVPLLGYVAGYVLGGTALAAAVSVGSALGVAVVRRIRGDSLRTVVVATLAVIVCATLALGTGSGRSFFAPAVAFNVGAAVVLSGSLLVRRPATGYVSQRLGFDSSGWRGHPDRCRFHRTLTLGWVAFFVLRVGLFVPLYLRHEVVALALVDAVVLKPSLLIAAMVTAVLLRRARVRPALA